MCLVLTILFYHFLFEFNLTTEQLPVTIDETDEENDVVPSPSIDDNRNVVFKDGKQIDDDEYDVINKRSTTNPLIIQTFIVLSST